MDVIQTNDLTKRYGNQTVVDNLNLNIKQGSVFGLLGPNGAGKTTVIKMILGLVKPTSGTAKVLGKNTATEFGLIAKRVSCIVETPTFFPYLNARQVLQTLANYSGCSLTIERCEELLDRCGIKNAALKRVDNFSLGMKQRLAVAAALITDPDILILDEPTNGLDPLGILDLRKLLSQLSASQKTLLISSHVLSEVEKICDEIAIIDNGIIKLAGNIKNFLLEETVLKVDPINRALEVAQEFTELSNLKASSGNSIVLPPEFTMISELIEKLSSQNVKIHEVSKHSKSLEDLFHETISN